MTAARHERSPAAALWLGAYRALAGVAGGTVRAAALWAGVRGDLAARTALAERLAAPAALASLPREAIWLHAASVGEAALLVPLVRALRDAGWSGPLVVTAQTATGRARAAAATGLPCRLAPVDAPGPVRRFLRAVRPVLHVVVETELWPVRLAELERAAVPAVLLSARISERRLPRYRALRGLYRPALARFALIAPASDADADRLRTLGAPAHRFGPTGNLKWDAAAAPPSAAETARLAEELHLGGGPGWLVLGSVHPGEAGPLAAALLGEARSAAPPRLIVAPRHPERFDDVAGELAAAGLPFRRATERRDGPEPILLLDRMGILPALYPVAQAAFLGGTLVPVGGHSPLEAAAAGCPVVCGPHDDKQRDLVEPLAAAGALVRARSAATAAAALLAWSSDASARARAAAAARVTVARNRGAAERLAPAVLACLS